MDDVALIRSENANLRKIQNKLVQWDSAESPLAPLTQYQTDVIHTLTQILANSSTEGSEAVPEQSTAGGADKVCSLSEFLKHSAAVEEEISQTDDQIYDDYYRHLDTQNAECDDLLQHIDSALSTLDQLNTEYEFVATNTSTLHSESEKLIQDQNQLNKLNDDVSGRLHYFLLVDQLLQKLESPTLSVSGENFWTYMDQIDDGLEFLNSHKRRMKDAQQYVIKYRQCLSKAATLIKTYVGNILTTATGQVMRHSGVGSGKATAPSSDSTFALYYGKFKAFAGKIKFVTDSIQSRRSKSPDYTRLMEALEQNYLDHRAKLMSDGVSASIRDLATRNKTDHCAMTRQSCAFLVNICLDEYHLFYEFFPSHDDLLTAYMQGLCGILYDQLRPCIIHINHLETLAEICSILRVEMLEEHVHHNPDALEAFGRSIHLLSQDAQERLVYRANVYLQSDILNYKPSAGDLAYPEKLEMMESIALSLKESAIQRADSRASMMSLVSGEHGGHEMHSSSSSRIESSPADLHGMWYPTVRRTLVCLSRLYRCVDKTIFQGLSQEALTYCIESVSKAGAQIKERKKSAIDGELFEVKHLLILREQIAPFRVNFTVKETSLDLSKVKTAAFGLLQKRKQLFTLGSNNALLEFLLEGSTQIKENVLDSRRDVDRQLKGVCEQFIRDATNAIVGNIVSFIEQYHQLQHKDGGTSAMTAAGSGSGQSGSAAPQVNLQLRKWASPQMISGLVQEAQRNVKTKLSGLQRSMQLYLANRDTEFILFRPIRNNIIGSFLKLEQLLATNDAYTKDDLIIAAIPSADQVSLLINASALQENPSMAAHKLKKVSVSSMESDKIVEEPVMSSTPVLDTSAIRESSEPKEETTAVEAVVNSPEVPPREAEEGSES